MRGVDSVESSSSTNATKNKMDKGVAGRNMVGEGEGGEESAASYCRFEDSGPARRPAL